MYLEIIMQTIKKNIIKYNSISKKRFHNDGKLIISRMNSTFECSYSRVSLFELLIAETQRKGDVIVADDDCDLCLKDLRFDVVIVVVLNRMRRSAGAFAVVCGCVC